MSDIGKRIHSLRSMLKVSQKAFANSLKVDQPLISKVETGGMLPSDKLIELICNVYDLSEKWLRYGEGPMGDGLTSTEELGILDIALEDIRLDSLIKNLNLLMFSTKRFMGIFGDYEIDIKNNSPKIAELKKQIKSVENQLGELQKEVASILKTDGTENSNL